MKTYDYIVIGSGFGGSVSSLRLAEKGYSVLTLEKGKKYNTPDFPKSNWNLRKYLWMPKLGFYGFQKLDLYKHAFILSGTGVGGGSLVYANTLMMPLPEFFANNQWNAYNDWQQALKPYYGKAGFMLGRVENEELFIEDNILRKVAKSLGAGHTFSSTKIAVYFNDDTPKKDPYFNGHGPLRTPCTKCAGCMVGCRDNAKNTLDKNYLYFAEKYGAEILPETEAWKIEYQNREYLVYTKKVTGLAGKKQVFKAKGLVVSGGVLGTIKLLLAQKYLYKTLPHLSSRLGECLRTNSETLCTATLANKKLNNGVAISSIFHPDQNTSIEIVKYPDKSNLMRALLTLATDKKGSNLKRVFHFFGNIAKHPKRFIKMVFNTKWSENTIIFLVMQSHNSNMRLVLKKWPFRKKLTIKNDGNEKVKAYIPIGQEVMHRYAKEVGGVSQNSTAEIFMDVPSTAHILGGCKMGKSVDDGVIAPDFSVHGYPNMYILDGSVVQGNPGVNPSFTITALAEYAMDKIPEQEGAQTQQIPYMERFLQPGFLEKI